MNELVLQVHQAVPSKGQRTVRYQLRSQRYLDRCAVLWVALSLGAVRY